MTKPDHNDLVHHRTDRARRAFSSVIWSGLNSFTPAALGLIVFILVSRVISPEDFGYVAFAVAIVGTVGAFSPAGFGDALIQRSDVDTTHLNMTFWLCLLWGIGLYGGVLVMAHPLAGWLGDPKLSTLLPVIGIRLIFDLAAVVPSSLLSRRMEFRRIALRTVAASSLSAVVCLLVLYLGYGLWALVLSQLVASIALWATGWMSVRWRPSIRVDWQALKHLMNFGGYASGSRLVTTINVEQILIGAMLGSASLGLFSFARRVFQILNDVLTGALGAVSYPLLSSMQNEPIKMVDAYLAVTFLSSVITFPIFVGLGLVAENVIPLVFGPHWYAAVPALQAFCAIGLLSCIGVIQSTLIRAIGRADWSMWYQIGQQLLTAAIILVLAPSGVTAVAVGIAFKTWLTFPLMAVLVGRTVGLSPVRYAGQFVAPSLGCLVMAAAVLGIRDGLGIPDLWRVILQIGVGGIVYVLTVLLISRRRLASIFELVRRRGA